jgi:hypothetical protein
MDRGDCFLRADPMDPYMKSILTIGCVVYAYFMAVFAVKLVEALVR